MLAAASPVNVTGIADDLVEDSFPLAGKKKRSCLLSPQMLRRAGQVSAACIMKMNIKDAGELQ